MVLFPGSGGPGAGFRFRASKAAVGRRRDSTQNPGTWNLEPGTEPPNHEPMNHEPDVCTIAACPLTPTC